MKKRKLAEAKVDRCSSWFPSREWLEQRNLKVVYDGSHRGWHLELLNPHVPSGKRPKYVPKPLIDKSPVSPQDGELFIPNPSEIDTKRKTRRR